MNDFTTEPFEQKKIIDKLYSAFERELELFSNEENQRGAKIINFRKE